MTDLETYKKGNIDKKFFSKIRNTKCYNPSKNTATSFVLPLELNLTKSLTCLERPASRIHAAAGSSS
ncbi:hypothetical protein [Youngiibacter fragilis]|nr:hypothetical protein [Youngiibacter fragilis]